jgi:hypothetical protein
MRIDTDKLGMLVSYIERWLSGSPTRNAGMLARLTGTNAQNIRRVLQKEHAPDVETALCILNIVASPQEALELVGDRKALVEFVNRVSSLKEENGGADSDAIAARLVSREWFWSYMFALTIGVTRERIEKVCGAFGVYEFEQMIEKKLLVERSPGEYVPSLKQECLVVENKEVYSKAVVHIVEMAVMNEGAQKLYLVYNVTEEDYQTIVAKIHGVYQECEEIARKSNGNIVLASAFVTTNLGA